MNNGNGETVANILSSRCFLPEITEKETVCGNDIIISYGLKINFYNGRTDLYEDITFERSKITELYNMFCDFDIDESHIEDVVCDFVDSLHSL